MKTIYSLPYFCLLWDSLPKKTGKTMYKIGDSGECNVISADGMLYVYSDTGEMRLIKPNPIK